MIIGKDNGTGTQSLISEIMYYDVSNKNNNLPNSWLGRFGWRQAKIDVLGWLGFMTNRPL